MFVLNIKQDLRRMMLPLNQYRANYEYQQDSLTFASS